MSRAVRGGREAVEVPDAAEDEYDDDPVGWVRDAVTKKLGRRKLPFAQFLALVREVAAEAGLRVANANLTSMSPQEPTYDILFDWVPPRDFWAPPGKGVRMRNPDTAPIAQLERLDHMICVECDGTRLERVQSIGIES